MTSSAMRLLLAALPLALFLCRASVEAVQCSHVGKQHNYAFGTYSGSDRLFYEDTVSLKSKLWRVNTVDVTYPRSGTPSLGLISYIQIQDLRKDGTGGCAYLLNGGVGQSSVSIHFKTQRNHGLDFKIKIFGH